MGELILGICIGAGAVLVVSVARVAYLARMEHPKTNTLSQWVDPVLVDMPVRPIAPYEPYQPDNIIMFDRSWTDPEIARRLSLFARIEEGHRAAGGNDYNPGA